MSPNADIDYGAPIDWGKTSRDYSAWRPNYPERFFQILRNFGVGLPGQRILDLGTGVGFLALQFAKQGALVTGVDISEGQVQEARRLADSMDLAVDFRTGAAEDTGLRSASFDVITASQSWLYFDKVRASAETKRLLKPGGLFVTSYFGWLPRQDAIAKASEELVLRHNAKWTAGDFSGDVPTMPEWAVADFRLHLRFVFDEPIPFTWESWRGRFRACRGIGATLTSEQIEAFDRDHDALLRQITPEHFTVLHRIDAHVLTPIR